MVQAESNNRTWKNQFISEELKDFINSLLKLKDKQRLGADGWDSIKNHSFFSCKKFNWSDLENKKMKSPLIPIINKVIDYQPAVTGKEVKAEEGDSVYSRAETIKNWSTIKITH